MESDIPHYTKITCPRVCYVCRCEYTEQQNVGEWKCTEHSGTIVGRRWTCCDKSSGPHDSPESFYAVYQSLNARGCIPADHRESVIQYSRSPGGLMNIKDVVIRHYNITPEKYVGFTKNYRYYRYDRKALSAQRELRSRLLKQQQNK